MTSVRHISIQKLFEKASEGPAKLREDNIFPSDYTEKNANRSVGKINRTRPG